MSDATIKPPRTIVLTFVPENAMQDADFGTYDDGNYWIVSENGRHTDRLDASELVPILAAILLDGRFPRPKGETVQETRLALRRQFAAHEDGYIGRIAALQDALAPLADGRIDAEAIKKAREALA